MTTTGIVMVSPDGGFVARALRPSACEKCNACGMGAAHDVPLSGDDWQVGDVIEITWEEGGMLSASLITYGIPLAGLLGGLAIGSIFGDIAALIGCATGLFTCGTAVWLINRSPYAKRLPKLIITKQTRCE